MNLLHIDASVLGDHSVSRQVSAAIVARLRAADPSLTVTYRDLGSNPPPHLTTDTVAARMVPPEQHTPAQAASWAACRTA